MTLITTPHLDAPDEFYEALIEAHQGLSTAQSHELNAKLVLLLANHVGASQVLLQALALARANVLTAAAAAATTAAGATHPEGAQR
ncbi:DUF2783 domain-containing protein [Eleftheria terrae]|uniref:DUF2783 domain-containing protein n=1 Tax=Eleftheria terrae TaxID=1597781 RepID=UPI00263ABC66|nr:DUF2783 domain-containing protein [Eleftheria terrae]WKB51974.1 DUF2783 domain-containing protein [Eleftheria terrae]